MTNDAPAAMPSKVLEKVPGPLMERYLTRCHSCGWERQFFGTFEQAVASALRMGWEFQDGPSEALRSLAYCPHCKLLRP